MPRVEQRQPEIEVGLRGEGAQIEPQWIERKGDRENVAAVLATWAEGGQGPAGRAFANRLNRTFFRVRLQSGAIYEIAHELPENRKADARWVLVRQLQEEDETSGAPSSSARPAKTPAPKNAASPKAIKRNTKKPVATSKAGKPAAGRVSAAKKGQKTSGDGSAKSRRKPSNST